MQDFRRIYQKAAAEGREARLFGEETLEKACAVLRCGAIKDAREAAGFYFEFPLSGTPCMDLLLQYTCDAFPSPVKFAEGDGFGLQNFFDDCAGDEGLMGYGCGFSFDLSRETSVDNIGLPGIYLVCYLALFPVSITPFYNSTPPFWSKMAVLKIVVFVLP